MNKPTTLMAVVGTATAMVLVLVSAPMVVQAAEATNVFCGQFLTQDTKLDGDLTCSGDALIIGADNVTLDLGGFTITGSDPADEGVVVAAGLEGVTIKHGTIQGFAQGVFAAFARKLKLSSLIFKNNRTGALMRDMQDVMIRNSSFLSPPMSNDEPIVLFRTANVDINNVDVHGGVIGVNIGCSPCDGSGAPNTNVKVRNSTFTQTSFAVDIFSTTDSTISNNHFSNGVGIAPKAIVASCGFCDVAVPRSGIKIFNNYIHDYPGGTGILLRAVVDSKVSGNQVRDNGTGIALFQIAGSGSTGNLIKNNITSGNGVDLFHDGTSSPNTWKNNSCVTRNGADIPAC